MQTSSVPPISTFEGLWVSALQSVLGTVRDRINREYECWGCEWVSRAQIEAYFGPASKVSHIRQRDRHGKLIEAIFIYFASHTLMLRDDHKWSLSLFAPASHPLVKTFGKGVSPLVQMDRSNLKEDTRDCSTG